MEKQRLADRGLDRFGQERLGDQIGRFRPFAREKPLRIRRYENNGYVEAPEDFRDRIDTRAALAEIDVGKNEPRLLDAGFVHRLILRCRRPDHFVTELGHQILEIQRDNRFIFNDKDARSELPLDGVLRFNNGLFDFFRRFAENLTGFAQ